MNSNVFFPADEVIINIAQMTGDDGFRWRSRGFYLGKLKDGLRLLSRQLRFDPKVLEGVVPDNLRYALPDDFFNLRNLWLYNGENCELSKVGNIYWKRNYYTKGDGYLANNNAENIDDPFVLVPTGGAPVNVYWWNIQDGRLMFSSNAIGLKFHMEYNGLGISDPRQPAIPEFLREVLTDYLGYQVCMHRYMENPPVWRELRETFKRDMAESMTEATAVAALMDDKQREDLYEELSRFGPALLI